MEARDGAEFHEQHLEFQLYHVGQTHEGTRQQRERGKGSVGIRAFLTTRVSQYKMWKVNLYVSDFLSSPLQDPLCFFSFFISLHNVYLCTNSLHDLAQKSDV